VATRILCILGFLRVLTRHGTAWFNDMWSVPVVTGVFWATQVMRGHVSYAGPRDLLGLAGGAGVHDLFGLVGGAGVRDLFGLAGGAGVRGLFGLVDSRVLVVCAGLSV
jgi:hypothetical protein